MGRKHKRSRFNVQFYLAFERGKRGLFPLIICFLFCLFPGNYFSQLFFARRKIARMERFYWNEDMETMQPAALRQLENEYLRTQLDYVWKCSAFYQARFAEAGVKREVIRDLADLPLLPFTEKDECRRSQQEHSPFGGYVATDQEQVIRVHKTSGTTG